MPNGPLTSRLQHLNVGDEVLVSRKPTGTLVLHDLKPGTHLYLLGTGTGLAPFMSIIQDPETYERFEKVVVAHGVRRVSDLAYTQFITEELPQHEFLGELIREKLIYHPTVTREPFRNQGRLTDQIASGSLAALRRACRRWIRRWTGSCSVAARECCMTRVRCWMRAVSRFRIASVSLATTSSNEPSSRNKCLQPAPTRLRGSCWRA